MKRLGLLVLAVVFLTGQYYPPSLDSLRQLQREQERQQQRSNDWIDEENRRQQDQRIEERRHQERQELLERQLDLQREIR